MNALSLIGPELAFPLMRFQDWRTLSDIDITRQQMIDMSKAAGTMPKPFPPTVYNHNAKGSNYMVLTEFLADRGNMTVVQIMESIGWARRKTEGAIEQAKKYKLVEAIGVANKSPTAVGVTRVYGVTDKGRELMANNET